MKRLIISSKDTKTYFYEGPAYRFGKYVGDISCIRKATSKGKAKVAFLNYIRRELGLDYRSSVLIDDELIDELIDEPVKELDSNPTNTEQNKIVPNEIQEQLPGFEDI